MNIIFGPCSGNNSKRASRTEIIYSCVPSSLLISSLSDRLDSSNILDLGYIVSNSSPSNSYVYRIVPFNLENSNGLEIIFSFDSNTKEISVITSTNVESFAIIDTTLIVDLSNKYLEKFVVTYKFTINADFTLSSTIEGFNNFMINNDDDIIDGPTTNTNIINFPNINLNLNVNSQISSLTDIPQIIINYTEAVVENMGRYSFVIYDIIKHGKTSTIYQQNGFPCVQIYKSEIIKSPQIQTVLKGPVNFNLNNKIKYIIKKLSKFYNFATFLTLLIFYSAARYILSALLYGKFSVKFLLGKYYDNFLSDLAHSRYCNFLQLFTELQTANIGNTKILVDFSVFSNYFLYDSTN